MTKRFASGRSASGRSGWRQLAWFIGLWAAGVIVITLVGLAIRAVIM